MALTSTTLSLLNQYINGVMTSVDNQAHNVNEIILTIAGAVIWRATQDIELKMHNEETENILWLSVKERKYAIAFNPKSSNIEIRSSGQNGTILGEYNNGSSHADVKKIFSAL